MTPLLVGINPIFANLIYEKYLLSCMSTFIYFFKFIYFRLHRVFVAVHGLSPVAENGGHSSFRHSGPSLRCLLLLRSTGSRLPGFSSCGSGAPECRLSSRGTRAQGPAVPRDLLEPGLEPASPELAGGFSTTAPPGKPSIST